MKKYRLAILTSHPIQYQVPLWRKLAEHPQIDLTVYFCSDVGLKEHYDDGFGVKFKWDIPLLEGYRYKFLRNYSLKSGVKKSYGLLNLGIIKELVYHRYDGLLIHGYNYVTHLLAILTTQIAGTKVFLRCEDNLKLERLQSMPLWKRFVLRQLLKMVSGCMAIGSLNKQYYETFGIEDEKIFLMPYSVDNEFFLKERDKLLPLKDDLKANLGIPPDYKVILYVAKFLKRKRALDLIQAYESLNSENIALVMVGDGEERENCEKYVQDKDLKNVSFVGFKNQSELAQFYVISDVFVLPSEQEPWGLVINEAMCFGLPVITTDEVGSAVDLVKDGENGFIYNSGNINSLSGYLEKIIEDENLQQRMGAFSLKKIAKWSINQDIEAILNCLNTTHKQIVL